MYYRVIDKLDNLDHRKFPIKDNSVDEYHSLVKIQYVIIVILLRTNKSNESESLLYVVTNFRTVMFLRQNLLNTNIAFIKRLSQYYEPHCKVSDNFTL